jgi:hypothetical protein
MRLPFCQPVFSIYRRAKWFNPSQSLKRGISADILVGSLDIIR